MGDWTRCCIVNYHIGAYLSKTLGFVKKKFFPLFFTGRPLDMGIEAPILQRYCYQQINWHTVKWPIGQRLCRH